MACPKCGCKVHYQYDSGWDGEPQDEGLERCAACRHVFASEDAADDEDDAYGVACRRCGDRGWLGDAWESEPCPECPKGREFVGKCTTDGVDSCGEQQRREHESVAFDAWWQTSGHASDPAFTLTMQNCARAAWQARAALPHGVSIPAGDTISPASPPAPPVAKT